MSQADNTRIRERLTTLRSRIAQACAACGRSPEDVTLIGVSKTKPAGDIADASALGLHNFGENYLREAGDKIQTLSPLELTWHYIGTIQSNKTKDVAKYFDWVHTVDRAKIGTRLSGQCPDDKMLNILIQVNIDDDPGKGGCTPSQLPDLIDTLLQLPKLRIRGLMTILSKASDPRASYESVAQLFTSLRPRLPVQRRSCWDSLSMGMTGDLEHAIAAGATHIRIGTALFGERSSPPQ